MPTATAALSFAAVAFLMALSPGPNLLYLVSRSICQGRAAGFASLAGVCTAMLLYAMAAAAGLSALFLAVPVTYDLVRYAGSLYLLWLAYKVLASAASPATAPSVPGESTAQLYCRGLMTCLLNPKVVVTYGALLPQFVQPTAGHILSQTFVLGVVQVASAALAHSLVILAAGAVATAISKRRTFMNVQRYVLGTVLVALAARLLVERRGVA